MKRAISAVVLVLVLPLTVFACLWDRDTPLDEALGMPEVVAAITGRFERNPPLFYEMRLARVTEHLRAHPEDLYAYDDAGVACDRLGRGDDAVAWMEQKRGQLDKLDRSRPEVKEHMYRYHANLGTFLVHRWARQGADRDKIDEVKQARDEIARAIEINPDAHFGREKYQLMALNWIVDPPKVEKAHAVPIFLPFKESSFSSQDAHAAVVGLAGLVVLGNAWESVDMFNAMIPALESDSVPSGSGLKHEGRAYLAYLARFRAEELIDAGKGSMLPGAPSGADLKCVLYSADLMDEQGLKAKASFTKLRAEADAWHAARTAYMMQRLAQGRHPDTDRTFWNDYKESPAPSLPGTPQGERNDPTQARMFWARMLIEWTIVILVLTSGFLIARRVFSRRKRAVSREF